MLRILADHCVHTDIITALRQLEFKVERAVDKGLDKASDEEIFHYILKSTSVLLTFDKDFGNIIRFNIRKSRGIVIVYIEGMGKKEIVQRVSAFFHKANATTLKGSLFIIEPDKIRVWRH